MGRILVNNQVQRDIDSFQLAEIDAFSQIWNKNQFPCSKDKWNKPKNQSKPNLEETEEISQQQNTEDGISTAMI